MPTSCAVLLGFLLGIGVVVFLLSLCDGGRSGPSAPPPPPPKPLA